MKKYNLKELENIQGGDFLDGACAVITGVGLLGLVGITIVTGGIGGALLTNGIVLCAARRFSNLF
jgi:hypothetical protein